METNTQTVRLSECCEFIRGVSFQNGDASTMQKPGFIPFVRAGNISSNVLDLQNDLMWIPEHLTAQQQKFQKGDIAICLSSGSPQVVGKTARLTQDWTGTVGAFCGIIRPLRCVDSEYIGHWFRSPAFINWRNAKARGANIQNLRFQELAELGICLPPLHEQRRIARRLREQLGAVAEARAAVQAQTDALGTMSDAVLRESLSTDNCRRVKFADCLAETKNGIGDKWRGLPVLGATRAGLAAAKEPVGKYPERYKPVIAGTVFYNPMRILLGSIAMNDEGDPPGITSPDYVVMTARTGVLNAWWFYHWFRSRYGSEFIKSMTRGAVRERLFV